MKNFSNLWLVKLWIRSAFFFCLDSVAIIFLRAQKTPSANRLLIVRLDAIGDYILWRNAAAKLIEDYSNRGYEIVLLANSIWSALAQKDLPPHTSWKIDVKRFIHNPIYRIKLIRKIANGGFNIAINPTYSRSFLLSDTAIRLSFANIRIGSKGEESNALPRLKNVGDSWYTKLIPAAEKPMMELARNAEFMQGMGYRDFLATQPILHSRTIEQPKKLIGKNYIVIFPGASWTGRQWPVNRFALLATKIHIKTALIPVICGGISDTLLAQTICKISNAPVIDLTGQTSLFQLIGTIKYAMAIVTNETSAVHIAAAVNTPSVCILGGGHFGRFMPYQIAEPDNAILPTPLYRPMACFNCNWDCQYLTSKEAQTQPTPCIDMITVESVYKQLLDCLHL